MRTIIIGAGPAGMLAGISSAKSKQEVIILEKMNSVGKKLGRCNITNAIPISEFIKNIPGNRKIFIQFF